MLFMIVRKEENILSYFEIGSFLFCFELDNKLWDFWQLCIYRFSHVIEWRCPKNDSASSENACKCKKPQKQAIQNHCNKFPVLNYLLSVPKVELKQKTEIMWEKRTKGKERSTYLVQLVTLVIKTTKNFKTCQNTLMDL